jgi:plasmid stabilization system protein ParE
VPDARIRFHPAAAAEVEAAMQWYAERSPIAARAFATEVNTCVERVGEAPNRWPRYLRGTRRYFFPHFSFSLVYQVRNREIEIVAVAHHRRRPGYWRRR